VPQMQDSISEVPNDFDVVPPIKARACDALNALLKSRQRPRAGAPRVMRKGDERC
jgi:hypothetical protein